MFGSYSYAKTPEIRDKYRTMTTNNSILFFEHTNVIGMYDYTNNTRYILDILPKQHALMKYISYITPTRCDINELCDRVNRRVKKNNLRAVFSVGNIQIHWALKPDKWKDPNNFFLPEKDLNKAIGRELDGTFSMPKTKQRKLIKTIRDLLIAWNPHFRMSGLDAPVELPEPYVEPVNNVCHANTKKGTPCKVKTKDGHSYCFMHAPKVGGLKKIKQSKPNPADTCTCDVCLYHEGTGDIVQKSTGKCGTCHTSNVVLSEWDGDGGPECLYCVHKAYGLGSHHDKIVTLLDKHPEGHPPTVDKTCSCNVCKLHAHDLPISSVHTGTCEKCNKHNVMISPWGMSDICAYCLYHAKIASSTTNTAIEKAVGGPVPHGHP